MEQGRVKSDSGLFWSCYTEQGRVKFDSLLFHITRPVEWSGCGVDVEWISSGRRVDFEWMSSGF